MLLSILCDDISTKGLFYGFIIHDSCVVADGGAPRGVRINGDVILGGLFPVHEKSER